MSVLIKGMDMPKNGELTLAFASDENRANTMVLILDSNGVPVEHKGVFEIPTPHGRLIDAGKFLKDNEYFAERDFVNPKYDDTLRDLIDTAPTVIEAEDKFGGRRIEI